MKRTITLILIVITNSVMAQKLGLQAMMDSLEANNPQLVQANAAIKQSEVAQKKRSYLGITSASLQYGQINTLLQDSYIDFDQEIMNPLSVSGLRKMDGISIQSQTIGLRNKYESLKLELLNLYVQSLYAEAVLDLYKNESQLFASYLEKARYMYELNEISASDLALVNVQLGQIQLRETQLEQSLHELDEQIHNICSQPNTIELELSELDWNSVIVTTEMELSPRFFEEKELNGKFAEQQQRTARMSYVPNLSLGYFNQTIEHQRGFQGLKAGLTFNVFDGMNDRDLKTAKIEQQLNQDLIEIERVQLENRLENVRHHLELYNSLYQQLDNASTAVSTDLGNYAKSAMETGEINPLEYIQVRQKAMEMELTKREAELNVRLLKNEMYYLTTK